MVTLVDEHLRAELADTIAKYSYVSDDTLLWALADVAGDVLATIKGGEEREAARAATCRYIEAALRQQVDLQNRRAYCERWRQAVLQLLESKVK
jgi:hypothetical protein